MIKRVNIVGNGRAAHFFLRELGAKLTVKIYARQPRHGHELNLSEYRPDADLTLLAVSDSAIAAVSEGLPAGEGITAHVSGASALDKIAGHHPRRAVFYPLMSLSAQSKASISEVPFCLDADQAADIQPLEELCGRLGANSFRISDSQRQSLHLAAVLAHNFSNHLYHLAYRVLAEKNIDFSILKPLLQQAVNSLDHHDPARLQTGPAVRNDQETIDKHLEQIKADRTAELYTLLTQSIQRTHEEKL